mgnify:CR=1 FL=1
MKNILITGGLLAALIGLIAHILLLTIIGLVGGGSILTVKAYQALTCDTIKPTPHFQFTPNI